MAAAAKIIRTNAKRKFTRELNKLATLIDESDDIPEINLSFEDLTASWKCVEEKHDNYVNKVSEIDDNVNVEFNTLDEWICEVQGHYVKMRNAVYKLRKTANNHNQCEITERTLALNEFNIREQGNVINELISQKCLAGTLAMELRTLSNYFEQFQGTYNEYLKLYPGDIPPLMKVKLSDLTSLSNCAKMNADKYLSEEKDTMSKGASKSPPFRIEKMPLPRFDGNIRNYAQFRDDFEKMVLPHVSSDESAYTLRQCISNNVRDYLKGCDDDTGKMLDRLSMKYGDPSKLVESIVFDIHKFKSLDSDDPRNIIQFIDMLECANRELKALKLDGEISNANIVSIIENKLPKGIRMSWFREIYKENSDVDRQSKFPHLLKYLCTERDALEYATSDLKRSFKVSTSNCNYLNSTPESAACIIHFWSNNHSTVDCRTFLRLSIDDKYKVLKEKLACFGCLDSGHVIEKCKNRSLCRTDGCTQFHHKSLHGVSSNILTISENTEPSSSQVMLPIMKISLHSKISKYISCLWDAGADISLITFTMARKLKLLGEPVPLCITTAGGITSEVKSMKYKLYLRDKYGNIHCLDVYGIERITNAITEIDVRPFLEYFKDVELRDVQRPLGEVHLLIGYNYAGWHPVPQYANEHLLILNNMFGKCIGGRSTSLIDNTEKASCIINLIRREGTIEEFLNIESLGVQCVPKCGNCSCGSCPVGGKSYSIKEERELNLIKENLEFKGTHWIAGYPWIKNPSLLPDNYDYALKRLQSTEKSLQSNPLWMRAYSEQLNDMIDRGVAKKLNDEEIRSFNGPVHYIAHHAVIKPESESTPTRIVFDSSHCYKGHSLNSYWAKGPDAYMNNMLNILMKFRENRVGFVGDIRKMYNSVFMKESDQHVHRFLWRNMSIDRNPDIYVITTVNMGDRPSGAIATVALRETALLGQDEYPKASEIVLKSTYVDDIIDSVCSQDEALKITQNISSLIKPGNFHIKKWSISNHGNDVIELCSDLTERVLGVSWTPSEDYIIFQVKLNFSMKIKGQRSGPDLTVQDLPERVRKMLTKRLVMSQLNGIYDPVGLLVPFTINGKILMRNLWSKGLDWDTPLCSDDRDKWIKFFRGTLLVTSLRFRRSIKPLNTSEELPILIIFSDGSSEAFGCCAYVRWKMVNGGYKSSLLISKSRVAPLKVTTIVRLELSAAVLSARIRKFIESAFRLKFDRVIHITDSRIVQAMIRKESYGFNTFVATRVGEIQTSTDPSEWYWVQSDHNIADIISRGVDDISQLDLNREWQDGPAFLCTPFDQWPVLQNIDTLVELPETKTSVFATIATEDMELIDINRYSNYIRLLRVTARILHLKISEDEKPSLFKLKSEIQVSDIDNALLYWIKLSQELIRSDLEDGIKGFGKLRKLNVKLENGVYLAVGRVEAWNELSYNNGKLIILPGQHPFSKLYARYVHNKAHLGVRADIAKIRSEYWIIGIQKLARSIRYSCVNCRKYEGKLQNQIMAPLPLERLKPAPAWFNTAVDLFGPYQIKGEVNKRSRGKGYAVIFTCLLTRAVYIDIAVDYSSDAFLLVFRRFVSLRGYPAKVFSDQGSQLIAASKELKVMFNEIDWNKIVDEGTKYGIQWHFSPASAPWYNGCCEALIRSIKKCIHHSIKNQVLNFFEMQTILFEVANVINDRPIGTTPTTIDDGSYLCPNDMMLGHSSNKVLSGNFDETMNSRRRIYFVQRVVDSFWKKWTNCYFASLLERPKWHCEYRNLTKGDVVLIHDKNLKRSQWRIGLVSEVNVDVDNKVRNVKVTYSCPKSNLQIEIERPVQRLVVLLANDDLD